MAEGAQALFKVIMDHKNMENINNAKRLNPQQAQWALLFTRINFTITYQHRIKNGKFDWAHIAVDFVI